MFKLPFLYLTTPWYSILAAFYKWDNGISERWSDLPKDTQHSRAESREENWSSGCKSTYFPIISSRIPLHRVATDAETLSPAIRKKGKREGKREWEREWEGGEKRESMSALKFSQQNISLNAVSSHQSPRGQSSDLPKLYSSISNISYTKQTRNAEGANQKNKALIIIIGLH